MENKLLYEFAKNFVDEYEKYEQEMLENEAIYADMNECDYDTDEGLESEYFSSCMIYKAGLQAVVVDDFVKQLPSELQSKVILECMKIKTGGNFTF